MRLILSLCFLFIYACCLSAQNAKIDSLKKVIANTKVDTVKGRSLCRLCWELAKTKGSESVLASYKQAVRILEKNKDYPGIAKCYTMWAYFYYAKQRYDTATIYFHKSLIIAQTINDISLYHDALYNLGLMAYIQGDYAKALDYFQRSLQNSKKMQNKILIHQDLHYIGLVYLYQDNQPKALDYYQKSLAICEKLGDVHAIAGTTNDMAAIYLDQKNFSKALELYRKALKIDERIKNYNGMADELVNIGSIHLLQKNYSEAFNYFQKSFELYTQMENESGKAFVLGEMGRIYFYKKEYVRALEYFEKSLQQFEAINAYPDICKAYTNISSAHLEMKHFTLAKSISEKSLKMAYRMNSLSNIKENANIHYQADSALGNWKSAFEHHKLFKQYSDSLHNEDKAKEFGRIESRYQFEKEAEETKRKEAEAKRLAELETHRRNNLQYLSIFAGLMVLFGGLAFVGKLKIPARVLDISLFAALLILFEFLLILFDPILDQYTGGIPVQKLVFNSVIALGFAPLHGFLERKLKGRFGVRTEV